MDPSLQHLLDRINGLSDQFHELREGVLLAIQIANHDPEMALIRARKVLEYLIRDVYVRRVGEPPGTRPLENLIQRLVRDGRVPPRVEAYTETIRKLGNVGAHHFGERVTATDVYHSLNQLAPILEWYLEAERRDAGVDLGLPPAPDPAMSVPPNAKSELKANSGLVRAKSRTTRLIVPVMSILMISVPIVIALQWTPGPGQRAANSLVPATPALLDDRAVAEMVINWGGTLDAISKKGEKFRNIRSLKDLPELAFAITAIATLENPDVDDVYLMKLIGLDRLEDLDLSKAKVNDALSKAKVTNDGVKQLVRHPNLRYLDLRYNISVDDDGIKPLAEFLPLEILKLSGTKITDKALKFLRNPQLMRELYLKDTRVGNEGMKALLEMKALTILDLRQTDIDDAGMVRLKGLDSLEILWLNETKVTDQGLVSLQQLVSLRRVEVEGPHVTRAGANRLEAMLPRCKVTVNPRP
jgi:hypothetical protein